MRYVRHVASVDRDRGLAASAGGDRGTRGSLAPTQGRASSETLPCQQGNEKQQVVIIFSVESCGLVPLGAAPLLL